MVVTLQEYIREANAFLEEEDEAADAGVPSAAVHAAAAAPGGRSGSGFLVEGQLSGAEPPPRQPDLMALLGSALGQQLAAAQAAQAQQQQQQQPGGGSDGADQQQQQDAVAAGPPPDVLEAIERELDAIAVQVQHANQSQQLGASWWARCMLCSHMAAAVSLFVQDAKHPHSL